MLAVIVGSTLAVAVAQAQRRESALRALPATEILRKAAAYSAQAELDRRKTWSWVYMDAQAGLLWPALTRTRTGHPQV